MKNQFFYTRKQEELSFRDSFNITKIIRSLTLEDGRTLILLDDLHERTQEVPNINLKTNKMMGTIKKRDVYQTEVYLDAEDAARFYSLTNIEK